MSQITKLEMYYLVKEYRTLEQDNELISVDWELKQTIYDELCIQAKKNKLTPNEMMYVILKHRFFYHPRG